MRPRIRPISSIAGAILVIAALLALPKLVTAIATKIRPLSLGTIIVRTAHVAVP